MTDGRASQPLDQDSAVDVQKKLGTLLSADIDGHLVLQRGVPPASKTTSLEKAMAVQVFGLAAGHVSCAKSELHQMSCFRWTAQGTREVAIMSYLDASNFIQAEKDMQERPRFQETMSWAAGAGPKHLKKLLQSYPEAIHRATVGPNDLLFIPSGGITFHRVFADADVLGIRCALLCQADVDIFELLLNEVKAMKGNVELLQTCCALFKAQPDLFVMKKKERELVVPPLPEAPNDPGTNVPSTTAASETEEEKKADADADAAAPKQDDVLLQLEKLQAEYQMESREAEAAGASSANAPPVPPA